MISKLISLLLFFLFRVIFLSKFKKKLIILHSTNNYSYSENTKYLFEYLNKKNIECYWITESEEIKNYLRKKNYKFITKKNLIRYFYISLKAKLIVSPSSNFHNPFKIISHDKNTIKINLDHGTGIKNVVTKEFKEKEILDYSKLTKINFTSNFSIQKYGIEQYKVKKNQILKLGYPRCDDLFVKKKIKEQSKSEIFKYLFDGKISPKKYVIFYTPTWRPYKMKLPILNLEDFDFKKMNIYLKKNDIHMFINLHPHTKKFNYKNFSNIITIDKNKFPFFDSTLFLRVSNILMNDCSTISTEACLINLPQIYIFPDLEKYDQEKGFLTNYQSICPGKLVRTYNDLKKIIKNINLDKRMYLKKYKNEVNKNINLFYDITLKNSSFKFLKYFRKILKNL